MSFKKNTSQFQNILTLVLGIAFGVVALAVAYGALKQNTEGRSKAAQEYKILKQWEFNSKTAEGWESQPPNKILVGNGFLSLFQGKISSTLGVTNPSVSTSLPKGLKSLTFSLAVGSTIQKPQCPPPPICTGVVSIVGQDKSKLGCDMYVCRPLIQTGDTQSKTAKIASLESRSIQTGVMCPQDVRACPDGSYVGRTGNGCIFESCPTVPIKGRLPIQGGRYTGSVYYKLANKSTYEKPLAFAGLVDGRFRDITVKFPEIQGTTIEQIKIVFSSGLRPTESVKVDWIRLVAPSIVPQSVTPTPTVTPSPTPACYPRPYCAPGAKCKLMAPPEGSVYCPTPTMCSTGVCAPPPPGCKYIDQTSCSCGKLICDVVTSTPTGTPTSTPHPITWGKALQFTNASYNASHADISRSSVSTINLNTEFTLEFWFKLDDVTPAKQHLFRSADSHLDIFTEKDPNGFSRIRVYVADGTNWDLFYGTGGVITKGIWHHFALTYLPAYMGGTFVAYLDGTSGFRNFESSGRPAPYSDSGDTLSVSLSNDAYMGIVSGAVDELRISTKARYPYTSGPSTYTIPIEPFVSDAYTRVLYHFDGTAVDSSGNMSDMSLTNTAYIIH